MYIPCRNLFFDVWQTYVIICSSCCCSVPESYKEKSDIRLCMCEYVFVCSCITIYTCIYLNRVYWTAVAPWHAALNSNSFANTALKWYDSNVGGLLLKSRPTDMLISEYILWFSSVTPCKLSESTLSCSRLLPSNFNSPLNHQASRNYITWYGEVELFYMFHLLNHTLQQMKTCFKKSIE
jgi:hypothetical protein